ANWYEEGIMSLKERDLTSAHKHFTVSLDYAKQSGELVAIGCAYRGLGDSWQKTGDEDKAHAYFAEAKEVFWRAGDEKAVKEVDNRLRNDHHLPYVLDCIGSVFKDVRIDEEVVRGSRYSYQ